MWEVLNICSNFMPSVTTKLIHFMNERKLLELDTLVMWWRIGMVTDCKENTSYLVSIIILWDRIEDPDEFGSHSSNFL